MQSPVIDEERGPSSVGIPIPVILRRSGQVARIGASSAHLTQGRSYLTVAAAGVAVLHGWEVLSLLGCHGSAPPSAVASVACSLLNLAGKLDATGEAPSQKGDVGWLMIPAFTPPAPSPPSSGEPTHVINESAALSLVRVSKTLFGTPSPRDVSVAANHALRSQGADSHSSTTVTSTVLASQRVAAVAESASVRVRHGTVAAVASKLGAAAAVIIAEGAVRASHMLEVAAISNAALETAIFALRRVNAAPPEALHLRYLALAPLQRYESADVGGHASDQISNVIGGRKRPRDTEGSDDDEGRRDDLYSCRTNSQVTPFVRVQPLLLESAVGELCSPPGGLVLPLRCFLLPPRRSQLTSEETGDVFEFRPVLCMCLSLHPLWKLRRCLKSPESSDGSMVEPNVTGISVDVPFKEIFLNPENASDDCTAAGVDPCSANVVASAIITVPAPPEATMSLTYTRSELVQSMSKESQAPVVARFDGRFFHVLLHPSSLSGTMSIQFNGVVRLSVPSQDESTMSTITVHPASSSSSASISVCPGPVVVVDFPSSLLPAIDAKATVDAALCQPLSLSDGQCSPLSLWLASTSAAASRSVPSAVALIVLLSSPSSKASLGTLPTVPLVLRGKSVALPVIIAVSQAAKLLAARAGTPEAISGNLTVTDSKAHASQTPVLQQPVAVVDLKLTRTSSREARSCINQVAERLLTSFSIVEPDAVA